MIINASRGGIRSKGDIPMTKNPLLSRPKDRSLEAFRKWLKELAERMGGKQTLTDKEIEAVWEKFWEGKKS